MESPGVRGTGRAPCTTLYFAVEAPTEASFMGNHPWTCSIASGFLAPLVPDSCGIPILGRPQAQENRYASTHFEPGTLEAPRREPGTRVRAMTGVVALLAAMALAAASSA